MNLSVTSDDGMNILGSVGSDAADLIVIGASTAGVMGPAGPAGPAGTGSASTVPGPPGPASVVEASSKGGFPTAGAINILYVAADTNQVFRWDGGKYVPVSGGFVDGGTP